MMPFGDWLKSCWSDHARDADSVAARFEVGLGLLVSADQVPPFVQLITHVLAEHLNQPTVGLAWLNQIEALPFISKTKGTEADLAIGRSKVIFELLGGNESGLHELSASDQTRAFVTAAASVGSRAPQQAKAWIEKAILLSASLNKGDAAFRVLAVNGNNLACALEEKSARTADETALMISAAQTARKFWEVAGTWLEVERAEYRLAMTHLKAGQIQKALEHAMACASIVESQSAPALEQFFAAEVLGRVQAALRNPVAQAEALNRLQEHYAKLSADDQSWCLATLQEIEKLASV